jgi:hypothetical protein
MKERSARVSLLALFTGLFLVHCERRARWRALTSSAVIRVASKCDGRASERGHQYIGIQHQTHFAFGASK